jgi:hypothetical protein
MTDPGPQYTKDGGVMTVEFQALTIQNWLNAWVEPRGGYTKVMPSPRKFWQEIYKAGEEAPRVLICWNGDKSRGSFTQANTLHRVDRSWIVGVIRGHGFKTLLAEGEGVPGTPAAIDPFYKDCQILRDKCRVLLNITEEPPVDFKSIDPAPSLTPYGQIAEIFIDGYILQFGTVCDIPAITNIDLDA